MNKQGRIISTANARLRMDGAPFAPTFMGAWSNGFRVLVVVSWFYEFDSRVKPQVPYAVFPTDAPCWMMAGLARRTTLPDQSVHLTTAVSQWAIIAVRHYSGIQERRKPGCMETRNRPWNCYGLMRTKPWVLKRYPWASRFLATRKSGFPWYWELHQASSLPPAAFLMV